MAFENMKADPEYREQILSVLRRDLTSSFAPMKASLLITVGGRCILLYCRITMENTIRSYYADAYEEAVSAPIDSLAFISAFTSSVHDRQSN
mgnify:CR=1 FL=1